MLLGMKEKLDALTEQIIGAAIDVHRELGPGLLESTYDVALAFELVERHLAFERQKELPVVYRGHRLECGYRIDFLVEGLIVIELKAVDRLERVHTAQVITYLRLSRRQVGLLINFNVKWLQDGGLRRIVNGFPG
jgi:GxxExxY protein